MSDRHHVQAILAASAAAVGGFLFGFDTAVINGAVLALQQFFDIDATAVGLSVSLTLLGSAVGAILAGRLSDQLGRRAAMVIAAVLFTVSAIGSGFPFTVYDFIVWRVIGGAGVGMASAIAPAYIAEVSPAGIRGRLGSLQQMAIVLGIFAALLSNWAIGASSGGAALPFWFGASSWRWMFWMETPAALLFGVAALLIPESPRYLVAKGRLDEARQVLARVVGGDAEAKVREIRDTVLTERRPRLSDTLGGRYGFLPVVWLGIALSVFQQFVGINVIFYYGSMLWRAVGFSESSALAITMITGLTNIVTTVLAILLIDRFGRRPLLMVGSAGMLVTLTVMAFVFGNAPVDAAGNPSLGSTAGITALVAANLYVFCFGFSWGPVVWVMLGEMFSNKIRAAALGLAACVQWIANFAVSLSFPPLAEHLGLAFAYGIYATFAGLSWWFVYSKIPETRGIELEAMGSLIDRPHSGGVADALAEG